MSEFQSMRISNPRVQSRAVATKTIRAADVLPGHWILLLDQSRIPSVKYVHAVSRQHDQLRVILGKEEEEFMDLFHTEWVTIIELTP